jgi:hypothetical protein
VNPAGRIQNVGNCELTHAGVGLGMVIDGGQAAVSPRCSTSGCSASTSS